jgi:CheY-like chemotaxis protein
LIADDDDPWRATLQEVFGRAGFEALAAASGDEALAVLERRPVDCLLLDFQMPGLTGLELVRIVRQRNLYIPVVMVTASGDGEVIRQAAILRVSQVLPKPVELRRLTGAVHQALAEVGAGPPQA